MPRPSNLYDIIIFYWRKAMTIIATCGHKVDDYDDLHHIAIKEYSRECTPAVSHLSVCEDCLNTVYKGVILNSRDEEMEWLFHEH